MRRELPTGTVTLLFTDVEGSTRLLRQLGAHGYAEALDEHRQIVRQACRTTGGMEVDTQGDAFFFAFASAPAALAAAASLTAGLSRSPIRVRVGLHTGTPLLSDDGYVGDDVHLAARVAAAAHGGQVICTAATANHADSPLISLGEHRLKDIAGPVAFYQLGDGAFPPLRSIANTNLPRPASSFFGRQAELAQVLDLVRNGARLVTLSGPGGTGKTRLAIEVATALVAEQPAGAFWVGLATVRDPTLVEPTIARTIGARGNLHEYIGEREMLLLLDNLEQVVGVAPAVADLVEACPNLIVLATSREVLNVRGEIEYRVPTLAQAEAVDLFCARSGLPESAEIAELCARLDNLPLAVELAAARTKVLSPGQISDRLGQRLDLLKGGRDADPRQQTLRATIEWSHELLGRNERELLARLSVFVGGWSLDAAEDVARADVDVLQSLVDKSLLRFTGERYSMLETIRAYAAERLAEQPDAEATSAAHFAFFVEFAEQWSRSMWDAEHDEAMAAYALELGNLRAALGWARQHGARELLRLAVAMADFWHASDFLPEGRGWLEEAQARAPDQSGAARAKALIHIAGMALLLGDYQATELKAAEALELAHALGDDSGAAHATVRLANARQATGNRAGLADSYAAALALARRSNDSRMVAIVLTNVGGLALAEGRTTDALDAYDEASRIFAAAANQRGRATCLNALADIFLQLDRPEEAARPLAESGRLYRRMGTKLWTAPFLETVSRYAWRVGDQANAIQAARGSAAAAPGNGDDGRHRSGVDAGRLPGGTWWRSGCRGPGRWPATGC